jgi:hypothetical protein
LLTSRTTETGRITELQRFSLSCIGRYSNELSVIVTMSSNIHQALIKINDVCQLLEDEYHVYRRNIDEQVRVLASLLWRHGGNLLY